MKTRKLNTLIIALLAVFTLGSCAEHHYYTEHHSHRARYYHRHHQEPPAGVDIRIHN